MKILAEIVLVCTIFLNFTVAQAQKVEIGDDPTTLNTKKSNSRYSSDEYQEEKPKTGKAAAQKYFSAEAKAKEEDEKDSSGGEDHYLSLGLSFYVDSTSYRWGPRKYEDPGEWAFAVSYRMGEWLNSTDLLARIEFQQFEIENNNPKKLSFMPVLIFPDARSNFPIYFGGGAGLGVIFDQVDNESSISLDYTLFVGGRLFNIVNNTGFFIESGLKNHFHLFSSGQLNGYFFTLGTVHTF